MQAGQWLEERGLSITDILEAEEFSIKKVYKDLRGEFAKVTWRRLTCNNLGSPKWIFMLYLAIHRRLYTKDRLSNWGILTDTICILCNNEPETHQQLFFECPFTGKIWRALLGWLSVNKRVTRWSDEIQWATDHATNKTAQANIYRITLAAALYYIWQERNCRTFQHKERTREMIVRMVIQDIHSRTSIFLRLAGTMHRLNFYPGCWVLA